MGPMSNTAIINSMLAPSHLTNSYTANCVNCVNGASGVNAAVRVDEWPLPGGHCADGAERSQEIADVSFPAFPPPSPPPPLTLPLPSLGLFDPVEL